MRFGKSPPPRGIKIFYTPRPTDRPGLRTTLNNASVAYLVEQVADPAGLRISYEADGVHVAPGDASLNSEHAAARRRWGLPQASDPELEASPELLASKKQRIEQENAAMLERRNKAALVRVGDQAPDFTCRTLAGEEFTLSRMRGKVVILQLFLGNLWAWETVQKFQEHVVPQYGKRADVKVLAIFGKLEASKLEEVLRKKGISYPAAADPKSEICAKYSSSYGTTYIVGKDGAGKQCLSSTMVSGKTGAELQFSTESLHLLDQVVQREVAATR